MKILFSFLISLILFNLNSQSNCNFDVGDLYEFNKSGVNLRKSPEMGNNILVQIISEKYKIDFSLEIIESETVNDFIKVKLIVYDSSNSYFKFNDSVCWVFKNFLKYEEKIDYKVFHLPFSMIGGTQYEEDYRYQLDSLIEINEYLKTYNSCKYSAEKHSNLYLHKGVFNYQAKDYLTSIYDLSLSIRISPNNKEILKSYGFRAHAKEQLEDYSGAISDYSYVINNCPVNLNKTLLPICTICSKIKGLRFVTGEEFCLEDLLVRRSVCYIKLNNYKLVLEDLNKAISLNPELGYAYYLRGQIKDLLKQKEGCCTDLSKAGELGIEEAYEEIKKRCK